MAFSEQEVQRTPCNTDINYIKLPHKGNKTLELILHDESGQIIDLTLGHADATNTTISFIGKTTVTSGLKQWDLVATITDAAAGKVTITATKDDATKLAGLFTANILIFDSEVLITAIPYYVEVTTNTLTISSTEPITISEVRLELRDTCPDANILLDELEFSDAEIIHCIRKAIDMFNSVPPLVVEYNTSNFPWRSRWLTATVGYLLRVAASAYRRNTLRYSAGGVSVDDKNKAEEYEVLSQKIIQEYEIWAQTVKVAINVQGCFGTFGSTYGYM